MNEFPFFVVVGGGCSGVVVVIVVGGGIGVIVVVVNVVMLLLLLLLLLLLMVVVVAQSTEYRVQTTDRFIRETNLQQQLQYIATKQYIYINLWQTIDNSRLYIDTACPYVSVK